jgi:hypothetical protein
MNIRSGELIQISSMVPSQMKGKMGPNTTAGSISLLISMA